MRNLWICVWWYKFSTQPHHVKVGSGSFYVIIILLWNYCRLDKSVVVNSFLWVFKQRILPFESTTLFVTPWSTLMLMSLSSLRFVDSHSVTDKKMFSLLTAIFNNNNILHLVWLMIGLLYSKINSAYPVIAIHRFDTLFWNCACALSKWRLKRQNCKISCLDRDPLE